MEEDRRDESRKSICNMVDGRFRPEPNSMRGDDAFKGTKRREVSGHG